MAINPFKGFDQGTFDIPIFSGLHGPFIIFRIDVLEVCSPCATVRRGRPSVLVPLASAPQLWLLALGSSGKRCSTFRGSMVYPWTQETQETQEVVSEAVSEAILEAITHSRTRTENYTYSVYIYNIYIYYKYTIPLWPLCMLFVYIYTYIYHIAIITEVSPSPCHCIFFWRISSSWVELFLRQQTLDIWGYHMISLINDGWWLVRGLY